MLTGCSVKIQIPLELPDFKKENYGEVLSSFVNSCRSKKTEKIYGNLCKDAKSVVDAKKFLTSKFTLHKLNAKNSLLTGYYEPELHGSFVKTDIYKYPIYNTPRDMINVDLTSIYSKLKNYRLRGRLNENRLVPYYSRLEMQNMKLDADIICYCDSKIDLFFLEVQGSGRVKLNNGETIYVGFDNQNGHKYSSIGKYLIKLGEIPQKDISLQSIKKWFKKNPKRVDEILNYNSSVVFFKKRQQSATGSLGLELTPKRSIAVDKRHIPLGTMLYLRASSKDVSYNRIVFAQDTGGAIKGRVRADMFLGFGKEAGKIAGELQAPLELWIFKPKNEIKREN